MQLKMNFINQNKYLSIQKWWAISCIPVELVVVVVDSAGALANDVTPPNIDGVGVIDVASVVEIAEAKLNTKSRETCIE